MTLVRLDLLVLKMMKEATYLSSAAVQLKMITRHNFWSDLDPTYFDTLIVLLKDLKKIAFT